MFDPFHVAGIRVLKDASQLVAALLAALLAGCSGAAGDREGATAGGTAPSPPRGREPVIPDPAGACPDFLAGTIRIDGMTAIVAAGTPRTTPGPLLLVWHATGGRGEAGLARVPASVRDRITAAGGLIVAPSSNGQIRAGTDVTYALGVWYDGADLGFADQVVACAVRDHHIDPRRIFTTGCSAGGLMAGTIAMQRADYLAAAVPNSGGLAVGFVPATRTTEHVPAVLTMHGGDNDNVVVNFEDTSHNLIAALSPLGAFAVECNHGIGHCGAPDALYDSAYAFMEAHPFGVTISPYEDGLPADFPAYCTIK